VYQKSCHVQYSISINNANFGLQSTAPPAALSSIYVAPLDEFPVPRNVINGDFMWCEVIRCLTLLYIALPCDALDASADKVHWLFFLSLSLSAAPLLSLARSIVQWLSAVRGKVNKNLSYHFLIAFQFNIGVAAEWAKKRKSFPCLLYVCLCA